MTSETPVEHDRTVAERHATWLELFFDLVIVVAVARLAGLLHDGPGLRDAFLFVVLFYAVWSVWTSFTLYANVSGDRTRVRQMLLAMFGIAIMAAAVPQVVRGEPRAFIWAYIWCRLMAAGSWKRTNTVMTDWPGAQQAIGVIPWMVSLGVAAPARYYLWVVGIALDVIFSLVRSRNPEKTLAAEQEELNQERARRATRDRWLGRRRPRALDEPVPVLRAAQTDRSHLTERLGLFVIIVLGEAVAQLVDAASEVEHWDRGLLIALVASFALLVALWWLNLQYGDRGRHSALRLTMPAHFLLTGSIVLIAAGVGYLAGHYDGRVPEANRWVLCLGAALYFLITSLTGARPGASIAWIAGWGAPAVIAAVLLGILGGPLPGWILTAIVAAIAGWHVFYRQRFGSAPPASRGSTPPTAPGLTSPAEQS